MQSDWTLGRFLSKPVPLIREENIVDLEEAEWTLTNYLKEETDELGVIIIGMLGLGKTTMVSGNRSWLPGDMQILAYLDDVWTVEAWKAIQDACPRSNNKCKVLRTTRNTQVAALSNVSRELYMLRFLTEEESWELLQVEVFGKLDDCPIELVEIGRYITKQCDGLQLAVVVIGKVLKRQIVNDENNRCDYKGMDECVRKLEHAY
ncbi:hypothetical protein BUALT_Bualt07G0018200 [Buddleja alternifolia]|uniref:NB-ARC domain-containing protein n=1 Tax=Buddleja alternifolia TaxID=168488 RepID=A0AAV6X7E7_9LAMI|nr:hypothetical protein BUALT_Bualt07G0018200 [Buddleja alternifolia]